MTNVCEVQRLNTMLPPATGSATTNEPEAIQLSEDDLLPDDDKSRITLPAPFNPSAFALAMEQSLCAAYPAPRLRIDHSTSLMELVGKSLRARRLSPQEGARVLDAELRAIELCTAGTPIGALGAMAAAVRAVIADLAGIAGESEQTRRDAIVLDDDEARRHRLLLAVESQGHFGRGAEDFIEFASLVSERSPDALLVALPQGASPMHFCAQVRGIVCSEDVPIVLFVDATGAKLDELAREIRENCMSSDVEMARLLSEIRKVLGVPARDLSSKEWPISAPPRNRRKAP
jgi:hypothetical protein